MRLTLPLFGAAGRTRRSVTIALVVLGLAVVGGGIAALTRLGGGQSGDAVASSDATGAPSVSVAGLHHGRVAWNHRVRVVAADAAIRAIQVTEPDGNPLEGRLSSDATRWMSTATLVPMTRYIAKVTLAGGNDQVLARTLRFRATDATRHLTALLSPGDGDVVGVGSPVIVRLSRPIPESQRAAVENRLAVSSTPSVIGAWHWMSDQELHWRPPTYWAAHTTITVTSDLDGLNLGHGVWGEGFHQTTYRIGDAHISRVDGERHQMYVYDNGKLIRTFPISAGRTQYPTKSGVHITFEKSQVVTMDSATVGIPRNSPDGYYEQVYWDVRISYGGAFVHAAPWSVAEQGIANVSHGCVNISTDNAIWFYNFSLRGDVVDVYNTGAPPDTADPGMADWNMSWKQWLAGDAAPTGGALALHPPLPHDAEPAAPGYQASYAPPAPPATPSPTPTHSPAPRRRTTTTASPSPAPTSTKPHHH